MFGYELKKNFIEIVKLLINEFLTNKLQANMSTPALVAKSFNIPIKSLKRWLRCGPQRKKGNSLS